MLYCVVQSFCIANQILAFSHVTEPGNKARTGRLCVSLQSQTFCLSCYHGNLLLLQCCSAGASNAATFGYSFELQTTQRVHVLVSLQCHVSVASFLGSPHTKPGPGPGARLMLVCVSYSIAPRIALVSYGDNSTGQLQLCEFHFWLSSSQW